MIERTSPKVSKSQVTIDSTSSIRMTFERSSDSCGSYVLLGRKDKMDNEKIVLYKLEIGPFVEDSMCTIAET